MDISRPAHVGVIGAGVGGLTAMRALRREGHKVTAFDRRSEIGGLWNSGYESLHLFTSKTMSSFPGYPMPDSFPLFPSAQQFLDYLADFAKENDLMCDIRFGTQVQQVAPVEDGRAGWLVRLDSGEEEHFDALVVANGHLYKPAARPVYPGSFDGLELHTRDYRRASQFEGDTVLVVGAGASATDVAADGVAANKLVLLSMRSPKYFVPASVGSRTRMDIAIPRYVPKVVENLLNSALVAVTTGSPIALGMPEPPASVGRARVTMSTLVPYWVQRGRIQVVPEISSFSGKEVTFRDGSTRTVSTIVWCNGYVAELPFFADDVVSWMDGMPARKVGGILSPDKANLYYNGWTSGIGSSTQLYSASADVLAAMVTAQQRVTDPLHSSVFGDLPPSGQLRFDLLAWRDILIDADRRLSRVLGRRPARRRDRASKYPWARARLNVF